VAEETPVSAANLLPGFSIEEISPPTETKKTPKVPIMARGELVYQAAPEPELGAQRAFFGAFNRAVSFLPDAAINTAVRGLEAAGIVDAPKESGNNRNFLERTFNAANFKEKEQILGFLNMGVPGTEIPEVSLTEKAAGAAGVGAAFALPVIGAVSRGAQGSAFAGPLAGEISRRVMADPNKTNIAQEMVRQSVASFANRPAAYVAAEVASSAVAGAVGEVEKEKLGFNTGIPALISGAFTSSLVEEPLNTLKAIALKTPTTYVARKGYEFVKNRIDQANDPEKAAAVVRSRIGPEFQKAVDEAVSRGDMQRAQEIADAFEAVGVTAPALTLAEKTLDSPLRKTQEIFQQRATSGDARNNMQRMQENIRRAFEFAVKTFPSTGDVPAEVIVQKNFPERFVDALTERRDVMSKELASEGEGIANETRTLISKFPSSDRQTRVERGQAIQDQLVQMKDAAKADLLKTADDLGLNAQTELKSLGELQTVLKEKFPDTAITEGGVPSVVRTLRDFNGEGMNFSQYREMRENIGGLMGDAAAKGQSQLLGKLEIAKRELDGWAEKNFGPNYGKWREEYLNKYQIPFENGIVYKVTEQLPGSRPGKTRYALQGELVADEIFKQADSGRLGDVQEYIRMIGDDVPSMNNMRNVILDKALETSVKDGVVDPTRLQTFVNRNKPVLEQLGIMEELVDANTAASVLSTRATALNERTKAIKKDQVVKLLDAYSEKGQTPEEFMDVLLKSPDQLGRFYTRIQSFDDDGLVEGFRAAAMNRVLSSMEDGPNAFADAMINNRKALEKILTPEGFRNVAVVNDALYRIRFAEKGVEGGGIDVGSVIKDIEDYIGTKIPSIGSYMRGMATNKQSATFLAALLGKNFISAQQQRAFDQMMTRSMYDTEFAATLATPVGKTGVVPGPIERRMRAYMFESLVPDLSKDAEPVEVTYDPETKRFRRLDNGAPMRVQGEGSATPPARGIPEFDVAPRPPQPVPARAPVPTPPATVPTVPSALVEPTGNTITVRPPGPRSSVDYESLFPGDSLGSMISKQG